MDSFSCPDKSEGKLMIIFTYIEILQGYLLSKLSFECGCDWEIYSKAYAQLKKQNAKYLALLI